MGPQARLPRRQLDDPGSKRREGLGRREPVGGSHGEPCCLLAHQAGHSHHEELVQIGGEDGAELHALEQRHLLVGHELEHAGVELDPRQLAVEESGLVVVWGAVWHER